MRRHENFFMENIKMVSRAFILGPLSIFRNLKNSIILIEKLYLRRGILVIKQEEFLK